MRLERQSAQMDRSTETGSSAAIADCSSGNCFTEYQRPLLAAKHMARQQLAVSDDSPFNLPTEMSLDELEKAALLREETDEIKRQLDIVRSRLNDFNQAKESAPSNVEEAKDLLRATSNPSAIKPDERKHFEMNQQATSSDSQFHQQNRANIASGLSNNERNIELARIRPLTGKTDCPNCECDKRRQSICDNCASFQQSVLQSSAKSRARRPSFMTGDQEQSKESTKTGVKMAEQLNYDERPIRPAKQPPDELDMSGGSSKQTVREVDREVVPNRLFSISKSLNDKRAQLAKAIEDLQVMMERVKKRGERLDQERKVAQLYKEQWRFGPTVGGGGGGGTCGQSTSQARVKVNYQSRFDPQLTRDSNSLMGFQHVDSRMKPRHCSTSSNSLKTRSQLSKTPQPMPRYSKMGRMPSLAQQNALSNRLAKSKEFSGGHHLRSKSLESLSQVDRLVVQGRQANTSIKPRVINHEEETRRESANGNSPPSIGLEDGAKEPEEELEEELDSEHGNSTNQEEAESRRTSEEDRNGIAAERQSSAGSSQGEQRPKRTSWVPVFGETEIKIVDRRPPSRKTLVLKSEQIQPKSRPSILRQQLGGRLSRASAMKHRSYSAVESATHSGHCGSVMNEASKKLKFANNLLEREKRDSRSRNQLIVNNKARPLAAPATRAQSETQSSFRPIPSPGGGSSRGKQRIDEAAAREFISNANEEIGRLEALIGEQQRVLSQLSRQSAACCCGQHHADRLATPASHQTKSKSVSSATSQPARARKAETPSQQSKQQLIAHLRDQLNKTKARLAKLLEEERAKHQEMEKRMKSSLRRQIDLRAENEMLRESLNKCIDTCLRDISSTFESLSETLAHSAHSFDVDCFPGATHQSGGELTDVAQLLADNRNLRQIHSHIESIESQRRNIFEELGNEKLRSKQLELQLIESKLDRDQLVEANKKLERKLYAEPDLKSSPHNGTGSSLNELRPSTSKEQLQVGANTNSVSELLDVSQQQSQADLSDKTTNGSEDHFTTTTSNTLDSIDVYRHYIQSMTPDLDAIRRERRMILDEFDNIKKMLANMND